jgi:hypothetical protein
MNTTKGDEALTSNDRTVIATHNGEGVKTSRERSGFAARGGYAIQEAHVVDIPELQAEIAAR